MSIWWRKAWTETGTLSARLWNGIRQRIFARSKGTLNW
jgi:hypothetical protein